MRVRHTPEQIAETLRRIEAAVAAGQSIAEASRQCRIGAATYYVWRRAYGGMTPEQIARVAALAQANQRLQRRNAALTVDNGILRQVLSGFLVTSVQKRDAVKQVCEALGISERHACSALGMPRSSHRYRRSPRRQTMPLVEAIERRRERYPQYGYRRIAALLRAEGWSVSDMQVYRLQRRPTDETSK